MRGVARDTFEREKNNGSLRLRQNHIQLGNQTKFYHDKMLPVFFWHIFTVDFCIFFETFALFLFCHSYQKDLKWNRTRQINKQFTNL